MELWRQLGEQILGENESLDAVTENLVLPSYLRESGVQIRWHSSEPELLSSSGIIEGEVLKRQEVLLQAELRTGDFQADFEIPVTLLPKSRSQEERLLRTFSEELVRLDEQQKNEAYLKLLCGISGKNAFLPAGGKTKLWSDSVSGNPDGRAFRSARRFRAEGTGEKAGTAAASGLCRDGFKLQVLVGARHDGAQCMGPYGT
ncbi:MAG: immunoglobulin-like domain-containing protein [Clostridium sp.]